MSKYKNHLPYMLVFIPPSMGLAFYGYLSGFTRLLADDYCSVYYANRLGLLRSIWYWRHIWSGRYSAFGADWVMENIGLYSLPTIIPALLIMWLIFSIVAVYLFLQRVLPENLLIPASFSLGSIFLFAVLTISPNIPQSLYWWNGMRSYSLPLITLTLYAVLFQVGVNKSRNNKSLLVGGILSFLLAFANGGFGETYVAFQLSLFTFFIVLEWFIHKDIKSPRSLYLLAGILGSALSMYTVISAPGNAIRQDYFPPPPPIIEIFRISINSYSDFIFKTVFTPVNLAVLIGAIFTSGWVGSQSRLKLTGNHWGTLTVFLGAFILSFANIVPGVYGTSEAPPTRVMIIPVFVLTACLLYTSFVVGANYGISCYRSTAVNNFIFITATVLILYSSLATIQSIRDSSNEYINFAQKWDLVDNQIKQAKLNGDESITIPAMDNWAHLDRPNENPKWWPTACYTNYYGIQVYGPPY